MTSMIDVVFLLLIFFVVTAGTGVKELLLPSELSPTGSVETPQPRAEDAPLTVDIWLKLLLQPGSESVAVDMNGTLYTDWDLLKEQLQALAELGPENPVVLEVAGDVPLGALVEIYDTCQGAGFETVNFATRQAPEPEPAP